MLAAMCMVMCADMHAGVCVGMRSSKTACFSKAHVTEGSRRFHRVPEGSRRFQKVPEGSEKVLEGSRRL